MKKRKKAEQAQPEYPEVMKRVMIFFKDTVTGITGNHDGVWDGEKWLFRKVYTRSEYVVPPAHLEITGWEDRGLSQNAYGN